MTLKERFDMYDDEYMKFDSVEVNRSKRPDLHAFSLLDALSPGTTDIVSAVEHDKIWLEMDPEELNMRASDRQIRELVRCGVMYDDEQEGLCLFV